MAKSLMQRGAAWMLRQQRQHLAVPVHYERFASDTGTWRRFRIKAVPGRSAAEGDLAVPSVRLEDNSVDFLVPATALRLDGLRFEPSRDDRILVCHRDRVEVYTLLPRGDRPHWRWSDVGHTIFRIHTRLTDTLAALPE